MVLIAAYHAGWASQPDFCGATGEGDLQLFFSLVIPEATRIISPVVEKYGFPATQEGEFVQWSDARDAGRLVQRQSCDS